MNDEKKDTLPQDRVSPKECPGNRIRCPGGAALAGLSAHAQTRMVRIRQTGPFLE